MKKILANILILFFLFAWGQDCSAGNKGASYTIHGASYQKLDNAIKNINELKALGYESTYQKVNIPGKGVWYRIYIGRYADRAEALKVARKLAASRAIDAFSLQEYAAPPFAGASTTGGSKNTAANSPASRAPIDKKASKKDKGFSRPGQDGAVAPERPQVNRGGAAGKTGGDLPADGKTPPVAGGLYETALRHFDAGEYEQALNLLKELNRQKLDPEKKEQGLTRLADCYYYLAEKGEPRHFLTAVDYYKDILNRYPDPRAGNAAVYYRLAQSYEQLKFYYETLGAFEKLALKYPDSPYHQEAMFKIGMMLRETRKFVRAVEKLSAYGRKYPEGTFARIAAYSIGDCYYQMRQRDNAENWYVYAQKKWHDVGGLPRDVLRNLGSHNFQERKFAEAVDIFSLYLSLYPGDEHNKELLFSLASAYREMKQPHLAVKLLSLLMEKYPVTEEAQEGAIMMANIGVASPGMKFPPYLAGIAHYYDPVKTYDDLLAKFPSGSMAETLLYQKGLALEAYGRNKEAFDAYAMFLQQFPRSMYREESEKRLARNVSLLVDKYYKAGDHIAVADLYFKVLATGMVKGVDSDIMGKCGTSLKNIGLYEEATVVFSNMAKSPRDASEEGRLLFALADLSRLRGKDDEAEGELLVLLKRPTKDREELTNIKIMLADIYSRKKLYEKAIPLYAEAFGDKGDVVADAALDYLTYANALREKNMFAAAVTNYQLALKEYNRNRRRYSPDVAADAYFGSGDVLYRERKYQEGLAMYEQSLATARGEHYKSWALYHAGQGYTKLNNAPMAEKTFSQLKENGKEGFWGKVSDYWRDDNAWFEKNTRYLK